jgi:hypothetical protein
VLGGGVARFGDLGSNDCQQLTNLCRVDRAIRVAAALLEGVTDHLESGIALERPLGGRGLETWRPSSAKRHTRQAVSTASSAYGGSSPIACQSASWTSPAATTHRSGTSPMSSAGDAPSRLRPWARHTESSTARSRSPGCRRSSSRTPKVG